MADLPIRIAVELDGIEYPELPWLLGLRGGTPDSQVPGVIPCTGAAIADLFSMPLITVSWSWNGFSGAMMGGRSKSGPSAWGVHWFITAPCGK